MMSRSRAAAKQPLNPQSRSGKQNTGAESVIGRKGGEGTRHTSCQRRCLQSLHPKRMQKKGAPSAGTFVIGKDGTSNKIEVLAGKTYYVKETKTPEGYLPDSKIHSAKVDSLTEIVTVQSQDQLIFGGVKVCKQGSGDKRARRPGAEPPARDHYQKR